jgi:hypothetical protein
VLSRLETIPSQAWRLLRRQEHAARNDTLFL